VIAPRRAAQLRKSTDEADKMQKMRETLARMGGGGGGGGGGGVDPELARRNEAEVEVLQSKLEDSMRTNEDAESLKLQLRSAHREAAEARAEMEKLKRMRETLEKVIT
jgi:hypothetical protein